MWLVWPYLVYFFDFSLLRMFPHLSANLHYEIASEIIPYKIFNGVFFKDIKNNNQLLGIAIYLRKKSVFCGETICRQNAEPQNLYFIRKVIIKQNLYFYKKSN